CLSLLSHLHSFPTRRSSDLSRATECSQPMTTRSRNVRASENRRSSTYRKPARETTTIIRLESNPATCSTSEWGQITCSTKKLGRSEEHTSELQSLRHLVCRL